MLQQEVIPENLHRILWQQVFKFQEIILGDSVQNKKVTEGLFKDMSEKQQMTSRVLRN